VPACPFCDLSPARRLHVTPLVFAARDAYAVTPGHTLVIPHRHVATYFEASAAEKSAIWSLVETVKAELDATLSPKPDGYNVGFNAGEAAGQTVMHLHVHVIPRYVGDVANPRGGVRGVIPGKADYTAAPRPSGAGLGATELTTGPERPLSRLLLRDLARAQHVDIAVAFVFGGGVERVYPHLDECVERGGRVRIVTGDYGEASEPRALRQLLALTAGADDRVQLRIFETGRAGTSFHPKAYLVSSPEPAGADARPYPAVAYVGSSNLSAHALDDGVERNVRLTDAGGVTQARAAFDRLWMHDATRQLDHAWIDAYDKRRAARPRDARDDLLDPLYVDGDAPLPAFEPHEIQQQVEEFVAEDDALSRLRRIICRVPPMQGSVRPSTERCENLGVRRRAGKKKLGIG
jgi:diadenosine tetraphosphate (Ap4A) HIT family hydrolase/HKD family nuclease